MGNELISLIFILADKYYATCMPYLILRQTVKKGLIIYPIYCGIEIECFLNW